MQEQAISKGIAPGAASWLFSSMGLGNFAGRLSFGLICDAVTARTGEHNVVFVIIAGSLVNGLGGWHQLHISVSHPSSSPAAVILSGFLHSFPGQVAAAAVFGLTYGGYCTSVIVYLRWGRVVSVSCPQLE